VQRAVIGPSKKSKKPYKRCGLALAGSFEREATVRRQNYHDACPCERLYNEVLRRRWSSLVVGTWEGVNMIRIDLVDNTASVKHVDFLAVPATSDNDFTCVPEGILPLSAVMRLSRELKAGRVFGHMGKYLWYRLKETPAGKHKTPIGTWR
jgi:hypothetical protein